MASSNQPNWNILIVGGAVVAGLYLVNQFQKGSKAEDYTSSVTGGFISDVTQPTIRSDIRQTARTQRLLGRQDERTQRVESRTERVDIRQKEKSDRARARAEVAISRSKQKSSNIITRQSGITSRVAIRQEARTQRQAQRQATILKVGSGVKSFLSNIKLKRKK